jgi:hypothetical protein
MITDIRRDLISSGSRLTRMSGAGSISTIPFTVIAVAQSDVEAPRKRRLARKVSSILRSARCARSISYQAPLGFIWRR